MGSLRYLLQAIPLNAVLREQVKTADQRLKELESEYNRLKERVAALTTENEELRAKINEAPVATAPPREVHQEMYGCYYFDGDASRLYCPRCYEREGKKHLVAGFRLVGHKCTVCETFIHP
jgi:hypothetical protein